MSAHPDMSTPGHTSLSNRMRKLSGERDDLPDNWPELADDLDEAIYGFYSEPPTVTVAKFMGCFARARRAWCDATGESLV